MIWVFQGDFGIIQKAVKVELKVKQSDPDQLLFDLVGLSDLINGDGLFERKESENQSYQPVGNLSMKASGFLAGIMNPMLERFVLQLVEQLVKEIPIKVGEKIVLLSEPTLTDKGRFFYDKVIY